VDKVGLADNFFSLGGHSLLLTRIHCKLKERFSDKLSIIHLFKYPTVKSLAVFLAQEEPRSFSPRGIRERAARRTILSDRSFQQRRNRTNARPQCGGS
jgi:acyl carrier protein